MTTVNESSVCSICNKPSIKYFCIGCKQHFCPKDFKEHEQQLSIKFDNEIVRSHDELLNQIQKLEKSDVFLSDLFAQINEWKITTINKVEKAAERAHHELIKLIDKQKIKITKQLETIAKEIRCRREEENFLEHDIDRLKQKLNEIQQTFRQLIQKDTNKSIIINNDQIDWNRLIYIREEQQNCNITCLNPCQSLISYPQRQNGYLPQQSYQNPSKQQSYRNLFGPYALQQQRYQSSHGSNPQQPQGNVIFYDGRELNDRLQAIATRYEINDTLTQRLNILQQLKIVVLCDDSDSMNTPVYGTTRTRWDQLRCIVRIVTEIGTVFDSNGIDVHFLNRPSMSNVANIRQVVESFSQYPAGLTPLTPALRRIFQLAASKSCSDKRLLVLVATDGTSTNRNENVDIQSLENLMRNERQASTTYVTFLACTGNESNVSYLSKWDRTMTNVEFVADYITEREGVRRSQGYKYPFSFGDYVVKALLGAVGL
ncbi:unnamed protein product [Rotaria sp. Silwood2]|nr:unnamed protein product [Rotaria sp. Silwood2]CAF4217019.1 unnamed protein product [Rotaria sp. Silwood2]